MEVLTGLALITLVLMVIVGLAERKIHGKNK